MTKMARHEVNRSVVMSYEFFLDICAVTNPFSIINEHPMHKGFLHC